MSLPKEGEYFFVEKIRNRESQSSQKCARPSAPLLTHVSDRWPWDASHALPHSSVGLLHCHRRFFFCWQRMGGVCSRTATAFLQLFGGESLGFGLVWSAREVSEPALLSPPVQKTTTKKGFCAPKCQSGAALAVGLWFLEKTSVSSAPFWARFSPLEAQFCLLLLILDLANI